MKNLLFLLVLIFMFMYGYYLMCKFDKSIFSPHKVFNDDSSDEKFYLLVFGKTEFTKNLIEILKKNGILYDQIENESQIDRSKEYKYLFVVSENDLDNLMFCVFAKRYMSVKHMVTICNLPENMKIFEQSGEKYYIKDDISPEILVKETGLNMSRFKE